MGSRDTSRREVLKTGGALASVGVLGSLSGCSDLLESATGGDGNDKGNNSPSGVATDIPEQANVVMSVDFTAVLGDQPIREAINEAMAETAGETEQLPSSVSEAFTMAESELGVDPSSVSKIALFGEGQEEETEYVGWLAYTDWSASTVQEAIEDADSDLETTEHESVTIYVNNDEDDTTERFAVLDDGTLVLGRDGATEDVIDIRNGDGDAISGDILTAWNESDEGYARFAVSADPTEVSDEAERAERTMQEVEYVYGSIYADGDVRGFSVGMEAGSGDDAEDIKALLQSRITLSEETESDDQTSEFIENTEVTKEGSTVMITNEVDVDEVAPVVGQMVAAFLSGFVSGLGGTGGGDAIV